jgi:hypothetical protein
LLFMAVNKIVVCIRHSQSPVPNIILSVSDLQ